MCLKGLCNTTKQHIYPSFFICLSLNLFNPYVKTVTTLFYFCSFAYPNFCSYFEITISLSLSLILYLSLSLYITFFISFQYVKSIIKICASEGKRHKRKGQNPGGDNSVSFMCILRGFGKTGKPNFRTYLFGQIVTLLYGTLLVVFTDNSDQLAEG